MLVVHPPDYRGGVDEWIDLEMDSETEEESGYGDAFG